MLFYAFANYIKKPKALNTHKEKPIWFRGEKSFHEYEVKEFPKVKSQITKFSILRIQKIE